jgi:hypothetical protein
LDAGRVIDPSFVDGTGGLIADDDRREKSLSADASEGGWWPMNGVGRCSARSAIGLDDGACSWPIGRVFSL